MLNGNCKRHSPLFICLLVCCCGRACAVICTRYVTMREKGCMDPTAALRGPPLRRGQAVEVFAASPKENGNIIQPRLGSPCKCYTLVVSSKQGTGRAGNSGDDDDVVVWQC
ncbi:hypothetical protein GGI35DRAFT_451593 [Trichoderma velutinum]